MNILLIRLRLIGDVVFTTPAVAALRHHFPDATITYLVERAAAPVVEHNPHLDRVIVAERPRGLARIAYDVRLARRLRRDRYDLVIDFHGGPRAAWLTRATGASRRIGYNQPGRFVVYTDRVAWTRSLVPPRHSVQNQWDLLRPLGIGEPTPGTPAVEMALDGAATARIDSCLRDAGVDREAALAVIHVSASSPFRRWPADRFAQLAVRLMRDHPRLRIVFTSGPSEQSLEDEITTTTQRLAGADGERVVRCGGLNLSQLHALIARAAVYIGGDSGPLHIAATTRTPIVAVFGPTMAERSLPWRDPRLPTVAVDAGPLPCRPCDQRECAPGDFRCLTRISVEQVAAAASTVLRDRR